MKKIVAASAIVLLMAAGIASAVPPKGKGDKEFICHKGNTIHVSTNAMKQHHIRHGDTHGPCDMKPGPKPLPY